SPQLEKTRGFATKKMSSITAKTASEPRAARLENKNFRSGRSAGCRAICAVVVILAPRSSRHAPGGHDLRPRYGFHVLDQLLGGSDLGLLLFHGHATAINDDEQLCDVISMVDVVADEDDRAASLTHLAHEVEHLGCLGQRQRRRGLVEHDEVRLLEDSTSNRN